jgi:hypothetical protein
MLKTDIFLEGMKKQLFPATSLVIAKEERNRLNDYNYCLRRAQQTTDKRLNIDAITRYFIKSIDKSNHLYAFKMARAN